MTEEEIQKENKGVDITMVDVRRVLTYKIPLWGVMLILFIIWWIFK